MHTIFQLIHQVIVDKKMPYVLVAHKAHSNLYE